LGKKGGGTQSVGEGKLGKRIAPKEKKKLDKRKTGRRRHAHVSQNEWQSVQAKSGGAPAQSKGDDKDEKDEIVKITPRKKKEEWRPGHQNKKILLSEWCEGWGRKRGSSVKCLGFVI